jgi:phage terminase large subunit-like protein
MIEEGWRAKSNISVMNRIVVEIDPAISVSETADETGIIVARLSSDGHGYAPQAKCRRSNGRAVRSSGLFLIDLIERQRNAPLRG